MSEQRRLFLDFHRWLLLAFSVSMILPFGVAWYFADGGMIIYSVIGVLTLFLAGVCWLLGGKDYKRRLDRYSTCILLVVACLIMSGLGSLPYILALPGISVTDAMFEAVSGMTSTGASVITDPASLPPSLQVWRSMTQWLGSAAFILVACWVLPTLNVGGQSIVSLTRTSAPVGEHVTLNRDMLGTLSFYVLLTPLCCFAYLWSGMDIWNALNHGLTTVALGGFSLEANSFADFDNFATLFVAMVFMLLACVPTARALGLHISNIFTDQYRVLLAIACVVSIVIILVNARSTPSLTVLESIQISLFTVISMLTGTGFRLVDYTEWHSFSIVLLSLIMIIGGCSQTPASGVKVFRLMVVYNLFCNQIRLLANVRRVTSLKLENRDLSELLVLAVIAYIVIYLCLLFFVFVVLVIMGIDLPTAIGSSLATLGNVGPGLGDSGPFGSYAGFSDPVKFVLTIAMLMGRFEIVPVILIFFPSFRP